LHRDSYLIKFQIRTAVGRRTRAPAGRRTDRAPSRRVAEPADRRIESQKRRRRLLYEATAIELAKHLKAIFLDSQKTDLKNLIESTKIFVESTTGKCSESVRRGPTSRQADRLTA